MYALGDPCAVWTDRRRDREVVCGDARLGSEREKKRQIYSHLHVTAVRLGPHHEQQSGQHLFSLCSEHLSVQAAYCISAACASRAGAPTPVRHTSPARKIPRTPDRPPWPTHTTAGSAHSGCGTARSLRYRLTGQCVIDIQSLAGGEGRGTPTGTARCMERP